MKRIISVFLILLLLLPAGCKQQNTETAAPGTVVENQVPDAPEQDAPEVVQPEEAPAVEEVPEQKPSTEDEADNSATTETTEEGFDKEAWLADYLVTAEKIYERMEEVSKLTQDDIYFHYEVILSDYPESVYWQTNLENELDKTPSPVKWYTPLEPLPDFSMVESTEIREICIWERESDPRFWTRIIYINKSKNTSKETMINDLKTLMSLSYVSKVMIYPHYNAQD